LLTAAELAVGKDSAARDHQHHRQCGDDRDQLAALLLRLRLPLLRGAVPGTLRRLPADMHLLVRRLTRLPRLTRLAVSTLAVRRTAVLPALLRLRRTVLRRLRAL